ncbi:hypothetical protein Hamer_G024902 [Homarus americanus]|uniref:Uncharacterized protein n=1 Tax=Homarus americanus TaxID=6706 RepID=A0A8J5KJ41_HOMAM|nr:hypothetical protein Hamer_G024902 [Homarus americanus]
MPRCRAVRCAAALLVLHHASAEELTNKDLQLLTEHSPVEDDDDDDDDDEEETSETSANANFQEDGRSVQHDPARKANPYR